jgi:hypothetical protein
VRRDAIDTVYDLAFQFVNLAKEKGTAVNVDAALGYAMQLLCADPEPHLLTKYPELWTPGDAELQYLLRRAKVKTFDTHPVSWFDICRWISAICTRFPMRSFDCFFAISILAHQR